MVRSRAPLIAYASVHSRQTGVRDWFRQTASPGTPRDRHMTLVDRWPEGFGGVGVWLAEKHHSFSRLLLGGRVWSRPPAGGLEMDWWQHQQEAALSGERSEVLGLRSAPKEWVCPWGLTAGEALLQRWARRTPVKALLNSRLKQG